MSTATGDLLKWTFDVEVDVAQENPDLNHGSASKSITLTKRVSRTRIDGGKIGEKGVTIPRELPPNTFEPTLPGKPGRPPKPDPRPGPPKPTGPRGGAI